MYVVTRPLGALAPAVTATRTALPPVVSYASSLGLGDKLTADAALARKQAAAAAASIAVSTKAQRNAAALEQARRATPAQKREALKNNRAKANAEFAKQGVGNFVEVLANGELRLKTPFAALDNFGRAMLRQRLPVFSFDARTGKVSSSSTAPGTQLIDAIPMLDAATKQRLKDAPFSAFLSIADPILDNLVGTAVQRTMDMGMTAAQIREKTAKATDEFGRGGYVYDLTTFPFNLAALPVQAIGIDLSKANLKEVNIALEQPGDELFESVSRRQIKSIRTALAFFVLFFKKWVELHGVMLDMARDMFDEPVVLVKTTGTEENTPSKPYVVDRIPNIPENAVARGLFRREPGLFNGKVVFAVQTPAAQGRGTTLYYTLSPKGLYDRAVEMRRQWDAKYEAYKNDKITNAAGFVVYGPRMTFLRSQGKTETQARNIIAAEDNFPKQFADARDLPTKFRVAVPPALGGVPEVDNGPRPLDADINRLKAEYEADLAARARAAEADAAARKVSLPLRAGATSTSTSTPTSVASARPRVALSGSYVYAEGLGDAGASAAGTAGAVAATEGAALSEGAQMALIIGGTIVVGLAVVGGVVFACVALALGYEPVVDVGGDILKGQVDMSLGAKKVTEEPRDEPPPPRLDARGESGPGPGPGPGPGGGTTEEAGFPVLPVALAAGLALLFLSRR